VILFQAIVESQYDTMRQQAVMHVCNNWDKFHEYIILTRDGYKSTMGQDGVYGSHVVIVAFCELYKVTITMCFNDGLMPPTVVSGQVITFH
jgi:hypothetical protein